MVERPYSRYTREKTWAALYSQHINAGYALVPYSRTNNSIGVVRCKSPEEVQATMQELLNHAEECASYYDTKQTPDNAPVFLQKALQAVILAKSSDYHHYHLADHPEFHLVICGLHDSYIHLPVWEMRTNKRYKPRETAVAIPSQEFRPISRIQFGHNILIGALINGDPDAKTFKEQLKPWTQRRIEKKVQEIQSLHYRGRPLAFLTDAQRREIGRKISEGLKRYYERKHAKSL
jgi:hypothetical protein